MKGLVLRALATAALLQLTGAARAEDGVHTEEAPAAPVITGAGGASTDAEEVAELLVFKRSLLLNEFVYRAVLKLPPDAVATHETAHLVAEQLAAFLRESGYDLASVRAQVTGPQIEVQIDEGALDKIIVSGAGWIAALRFRAALNLPLDVFNRRVFEAQLRRLAKQFGFKTYKFELWPVHLIDGDQGTLFADIEELRAMPMIRAARGYELRIFTTGEAWGSGFSPEVILNGQIGTGLGGRYRLKDIFQDGDRWQAHFRVGGAFRSYLDGSGSRFVNTNDYLTTRWLSKPWDGSSRGLRMTIAPRAELWHMQRRDLHLESYKIGTLELGTGAGAQLTSEFALFFTGGLQRRWLFEPEPEAGFALDEVVSSVPKVSWRGFLRANSIYIFNPAELRADLKNTVTLELNLFRPTVKGDTGFLKFDLVGKRLLAFGWHEVRVQLRVNGELGDVIFADELPLNDHLRIGPIFDKYTKRAASVSLEFRYSLLRDKVKIGVFNDLAVWRHLPRVDKFEFAELAGSAGGGIFFFVFDELQIDVFYGVGWSTDESRINTGLSLAIKEAF